MTVRELKNFMSLEQNVSLTDEECKQIIEEYEPSILRRKSQLLSASGFSHFMVFDEMHDLIDHYQTEHVTQVMFKIEFANSSQFTVECFLRFCFVVKMSADNVILKFFDIFAYEFSLFSAQLSFYALIKSIGLKKRLN